MSYPVSYYDATGKPVEGAAKATEAFAEAVEHVADITDTPPGDFEPEHVVAETIRALELAGMVVTLREDPFGGQIARVKIEAFGESASEVEQTLREYGGRCDAASQASECAHGEMVIERNLSETDGEIYSWKGRLTLHPVFGRMAAARRQEV